MTQILESKTTEYCYVPLLKNAHTWGESIFRNLNFEEKDFIFKKEKKYIIFLRDPIDRWLSGIAQFLEISKIDLKLDSHLDSNFKLDELHLHLLCTVIGFDAHTQGQFRYIRQYNPELERGKCIYFYMNDINFVNNVKHFLYKTFQTTISTNKINSIEENTFKKNVRRQIESALENNINYKNNVLSYFEEDYDFIKKCNFYNPNSSAL